MSIIDDFSCFKPVYLLKCKSETFTVFKQFKAWAENVTGLRMSSLCNNATATRVKNTCSESLWHRSINHGIQRQHFVRDGPQQNDVAKRANRTIEKGVISMLNKSSMPLSFWG